MNEILSARGWYNSGGCGCTPKKYKWKNESYPNMYIRVCPARNTWELYENDLRIRLGQSQSLESQYNEQFKQQ